MAGTGGYDTLEVERPSARAATMPQNLPVRASTLVRGSSRASLLVPVNQDDKCPQEQWTFDEDAYSLSIISLYQADMSLGCWSCLLAPLTALLQLSICLLVFTDLLDVPEEDPEMSRVRRLSARGAKVLCCGLCLLQLSDEACEGFHKMIFAIRWYAGVYDNRWHQAAKFAVLISCCQVLIGLLTCSLCIRVIFCAPTTLDVFFNYVALAFISDVDNMILRSRLVRSVVVFDPEILVTWERPDHEDVNGHWCKPMAEVVNINGLALAVVILMFHAFKVNAQHISVLESDDWIRDLLSATGLAVACNATLWFGSRQFFIIYVAVLLTLVLFSVMIVDFVLQRQTGYCMLGPLDQAVVWNFLLMSCPTASASIPNCFQSLKGLPVLVQLAVGAAVVSAFSALGEVQILT
eukprot:TRINITY_DN31349_c0_g1_i1.p1 TRINITY_DN31349_c0_g1~~TRINITY_DN31349_c0_g1_i1.p1  ORF type:complete len:415 (+),score=58.76 TRINITY_DN31349_c0_g1_i1:26-1246(+)